MDTVTQALLGGAVGFAIAKKEHKRRAMLWGAGIAILPDLDVLVPYANDLDSMTYHRSWSHSWFVQTAFAPILALLLSRIDTHFDYRFWVKLIWLALVTHSALDALTVYGTQIFWPLMPTPASIGSVFIIDPIYSLPLLIAFLWVLLKPLSAAGRRFMNGSFIFSCLYLLWGLGTQQWLASDVKTALQQQHLHYSSVKLTPTAFNSLLWRIVVTNEQDYYEGYISVFDNGNKLKLTQHSRGIENLTGSDQFAAVQRLKWFTGDFYKLENQHGLLIASDLRMGMEPDYFFQFNIARHANNSWQAVAANQVQTERNTKAGLQWVWQRIWNPSQPPYSIQMLH